MTAASPSAHSDIVGGSSAARILACPGSYKLLQQLPKEDRSSPYASEGTALHECMAYILENDIFDAQEVLGMEFEADGNTYEMTQELIDECVAPALSFINRLDELAESEGGLDIIVEKQVEFPGIPGAFGTSDVIARTDKRTIVLDWKFGAGVPVSPVENEQGQFYARAAMHTFPDMFEADDPEWPVEILICQPRIDGEAVVKGEMTIDEWLKEARWSTTIRELEDFRMRLVRAAAEAVGEGARIKDGKHCRFARCKAICPAHMQGTTALAEVAGKLNKLQAQAGVMAETGQHEIEYGEKLALGLQLKEMLEPMFAEIANQAHLYLESGGKVPGWKLVPKRAMRKWVDEAKAERALAARGLSVKDRREVKVISPAKAEKALAKIGEAFDEKTAERLIEAVSSGTTIAPESDNRQALEATPEVVKALADKIAGSTS